MKVRFEWIFTTNSLSIDIFWTTLTPSGASAQSWRHMMLVVERFGRTSLMTSATTKRDRNINSHYGSNQQTRGFTLQNRGLTMKHRGLTHAQ